MKHVRMLPALLFLMAISLVASTASGVPTQVWVNSLWTGQDNCGGHQWLVDAFPMISSGVDAVGEGGTVWISAGTYEEQVVISKDNLRLIGAGSGDGGTWLQANNFDTVPCFNTGSTANTAIIYVHDATGVSIYGIKVDGLSRADSYPRFIGIAFWNAGGLVSGCRVTRTCGSPPTAANGIGILAANSTARDTTGAPSYSVSVLDTNVDQYEAAGMILTGKNLTVSVIGCTATGSGETDLFGQTGFQIGYGASGTITDCHTTGHFYIGVEDFVGTGFKVSDTAGPVVFSYGCTSEADEIGVDFENASGAIREVVVSHDGDMRNGIIVRNAQTTHSITDGGGIYTLRDGPNPVEIGGPMSVEVTGCDLQGHGQKGLSILSDGGEITAIVVGNRIHNWETGLLVEGASAPLVTVYGNRFYENTTADATDNGASPPSQWDYVSGSGPGNYWEHYSGTGHWVVDGSAGAVDFGPNPTVSFSMRGSAGLVNCTGSVVLTVSMTPVACLRTYELLFQYDQTRWNSPTFRQLLDLSALGEVEDNFQAYSVGTGKWRIVEEILGHTSGYAAATEVDVCEITLTPKTSGPQGTSNFTLGTSYGSVEYPKIYDNFNDEIESAIASGKVGTTIDCSSPSVNDVIDAGGGTRDGGLPKVVVSGQEAPYNSGGVAKLYYQYKPEGHPCADAISSWHELTPVALPPGSWSTDPVTYEPSTEPDFIGPCTMYVMAEDLAGNRGYCAGAATFSFTWDPGAQDDGDDQANDEQGTTDRYNLGDAKPNPFNPRTQISFDLPEAANVRLVVYDVTGRVVRTLVEGAWPAGRHSVEWNGRDDAARELGSGIYFYKVQAGAFTTQKRVTLLK